MSLAAENERLRRTMLAVQDVLDRLGCCIRDEPYREMSDVLMSDILKAELAVVNALRPRADIERAGA